MSSDWSTEHGRENAKPNEAASSGIQPFALPQFAVQLQNILPVEIVAKRLPDNAAAGPAITPDMQLNQPNIQLNIREPLINSEAGQAQVLMEIQVESSSEPFRFEILLKLAGLFTYAPEYDLELVRQFLQFGSLSVMLPSARELLLSLCTRLQIPLIVLPLVQLAPPPTDTQAEDASQEH